MPTKAVTTRQKNAQAIVAAGETHAATIVEHLGPVIKAHLPKKQEPPDLALLLTALLGVLTARCDTMVTADEAHETELGDDAAPRDARDQANDNAIAHLISLREMSVGMFGADAAKAMGLAAMTSRDPVVVERYAGEVAKAVRGVNPGTSRIKGAQWNCDEVADALDEKRAVLKAASKDVARELREAQGTLEAKNASVAAFDEVYVGLAQVVSGLLRLSGKRELADKLLPPRTRGSKAVDETAQVTPPGTVETPA